MPARMTATLLALAAFALAIVMGIVADNPGTTTIKRALIAMACCYGVGYLVGWIAQRAAREHVDRYKQTHPLDSSDEGEMDLHVPAASENAADNLSQEASGSPAHSQPQAA